MKQQLKNITMKKHLKDTAIAIGIMLGIGILMLWLHFAIR